MTALADARWHKKNRKSDVITAGVMLIMLTILVTAWEAVTALLNVRWHAHVVQSESNMRQISLAMLHYHDTYKRLPPSVVFDEKGRPLYSWRVLLLPFLEEEGLYEQFHLDESWDSPHNKKLLARMPKVYASPTDGFPPPDFKTHYLVFDSPGCIWDSGVEARRQQPSLEGLVPTWPKEKILVYRSDKTVRIPDSFPNGTSKTTLLIEADKGVPWTKPEDLSYSPGSPLPELGGLHDGIVFLVARADGEALSTHCKSISDAAIRAAIMLEDN